MLPGSETFSAVAEKFGKGVIASDGTLDRRHLREIVFSSPEALAFLESVTSGHNEVYAEEDGGS